MTKLKISPTLLNEWASLLNGDYELWGKDQNAIREYILGEYQPNYATSKGSAVHEMLEHGADKYFDGQYYRVYEKEFDKIWKFSPETGVLIGALQKTIAGGVFETWNNLEIKVGRYTVQMNMRHDYIRGLELHEFKTSKRAKKYEDYLNSFQMKCYLLALPDVDFVTYHAIQVPDENKSGFIAWAKYQKFVYERTGAEEEQVKGLLSSLIEFIVNDPELFRKLER